MRNIPSTAIDEPLDVRRDKLHARVARHVAEGARHQVTEFLGEMICTHFREEDGLPLRGARSDPQLMNDRMCRALSNFVSVECSVNALAIILLEDRH